MTTALITRRADLSIALNEEANALKNDALEVAALVGKVTNAGSQEVAVQAQQRLKSVLDLIERARKAAKEPILEAGRQIDQKVKDFRRELEDEYGRIQDLVGEFQREEVRKLSAERERQRLELERIEREKQAEISRINAEAQARQAELDRQAEAARNEQERLKSLQEKAMLQEAAAREKIAVEQQSQIESAVVAPPLTTIKARGQVVKDDWEITVLNPYELARYHPDCVLRIEHSVSAIKTLLNQGITVRGVTARKVTTSTVRAGRQPQAIEV